MKIINEETSNTGSVFYNIQISGSGRPGQYSVVHFKKNDTWCVVCAGPRDHFAPGGHQHIQLKGYGSILHQPEIPQSTCESIVMWLKEHETATQDKIARDKQIAIHSGCEFADFGISIALDDNHVQVPDVDAPVWDFTTY